MAMTEIKRDANGKMSPTEPIVGGQKRSNKQERKKGKSSWLKIPDRKEEPKKTETPWSEIKAPEWFVINDQG